MRRIKKCTKRREHKVPSFTLRTLDLFFLEERISDLLDTKFQEQAFQDCFLVELHLHGGNKLEVFIDCDKGVTLEKCRQISRFLESHIEENQWLGAKYTLDVSSPGLSRPLKLWRQYRKNTGRNVAVTLKTGVLHKGLLKEVHEEHIVLVEQQKEKVGKKKKTVEVHTELPFEQIEKTMILVSF